MKVSPEAESTDVPSVANKSRDSKPTGRHKVFTHFSSRSELGSLQAHENYPSSVQEPNGSEKRPCSSSTKNLEMLQRRITMFSVRENRISFAASVRSRGTGHLFFFCVQSYQNKERNCSRHDEYLQKFAPPDQKPSLTHSENSLEFLRACEDLRCTHYTQPHTDQKPKDLWKTRSVE